jgi:hypothetical protein
VKPAHQRVMILQKPNNIIARVYVHLYPGSVPHVDVRNQVRRTEILCEIRAIQLLINLCLGREDSLRPIAQTTNHDDKQERDVEL